MLLAKHGEVRMSELVQNKSLDIVERVRRRLKIIELVSFTYELFGLLLLYR